MVESKKRKPKKLPTNDEDADDLDPRDPERSTVAKPGEDIIEVPVSDDDHSKVLKI